MAKSTLRFFTVLLIAIATGILLYISVRYLFQPIAEQFAPEPSQAFTNTQALPFELPDFKSFVRGLSSIVKNITIFAIITITVEVTTLAITKFRKTKI